MRRNFMFDVTYKATMRGSIIALWHRPSVFEKKIPYFHVATGIGQTYRRNQELAMGAK